MAVACSTSAGKTYAITFAATTVLLCAIIGGWILRVYDSMGAEDEKLRTLRLKVKCSIRCTGKSEKECEIIRRLCASEGFHTNIFSAFPQACICNAAFLQKLNETADEAFSEKATDFLLDASESQQRDLSQASQAHYTPPRVIIQSFPTRQTNVVNSLRWNEVTDFERYRATFTVSSGPPNAFSNGAMVVPESGLYFVYGKLTFACAVADGKAKHVAVDVRVEEYPDYPPYLLLSDRQRAPCHLEGDLTTSYQSGLFRLAKGYKLHLRYKVSNNVQLSAGQNAPFKSYFGMNRVGLV